MLQSFRGTIDRFGIRSLREETDEPIRFLATGSLAEFWAVMDASELPTIRAAVSTGDRSAALSLLCERSVSMGMIHRLR